MTTRRFRDRGPGGSAQRLRFRPRVDAVEARLVLSALMVTTTADSGPGSLRQAIMDSNASTNPSTIDFDIGSGGQQTIVPATPLPAITNPVTIDGTTEPGYDGVPLIQINGSQIYYANTTPPNSFPIPNVDGLTIQASNTTIKGLVINRFTGNGITIQGNGRNTIVDDYIGTDLTGMAGLGNGHDGVYILNSRNNVIGGTSAADANVISANGGSGVELTTGGGQGVTGGNVVEGNLIGTDATGTNDLGNTYDGVTINSSTNNVIGGLAPGAGNTIAFNGGDGIKAGDFNFIGHPISTTILSNSIHDNSGLGIELSYDTTAPVFSARLTSAFPTGSGTTVQGTFFANALTPYTLQFFSNDVPDPSGAGQGQTLVGSATVTTDASGNGHFSVTRPGAVAVGQSLTATATGPANDTSAFFGNTQVVASASADLAVSQSVDQPVITAGNTLTYSISVSNYGPSDATGVVLTDTLPPGLTVSSVNTTLGTATQADGVVTVDLGTMPAGDNESVQIGVVTTTAGPISNTVTVAGDQSDPNLKNNTSTLNSTVVANPNPLTITGQRLLVGLNSINGIVLSFNQPLDPLQATNPINYNVMGVGANGIFIIPVPLNTPVYNPVAQTVTLTPTQPLALGKLYQLVLDGPGSAGLTNPAGNLLVGNTSVGAMGPWVLPISRGYDVTPTRPKPSTLTANQRTPEVKPIKSVTTRHILTGSATKTATGAAVNKLSPHVKTTGGTKTIKTH